MEESRCRKASTATVQLSLRMDARVGNLDVKSRKEAIEALARLLLEAVGRGRRSEERDDPA
jgi:hypothetical protein